MQAFGKSVIETHLKQSTKQMPSSTKWKISVTTKNHQTLSILIFSRTTFRHMFRWLKCSILCVLQYRWTNNSGWGIFQTYQFQHAKTTVSLETLTYFCSSCWNIKLNNPSPQKTIMWIMTTLCINNVIVYEHHKLPNEFS